MKIRVLGNSIRFRLTVSEVGALCSTGHVEERTIFPSGTFTYAVQKTGEASGLEAKFEGGNIILLLPAKMGEGWAENSVVGFESEQEVPGGKKLKLLLEKDFACLEKRETDDRDTYPNPKSNTA
jgi:hypothetical protein